MSSDTQSYEVRRHPVLRALRELGGAGRAEPDRSPPTRGAKIFPLRRSLFAAYPQGRAADM